MSTLRHQGTNSEISELGRVGATRKQTVPASSRELGQVPELQDLSHFSKSQLSMAATSRATYLIYDTIEEEGKDAVD
jgi:hypothetical protein